MQHTITISEDQRQLLLMALAHLAFERPGFDLALAEIAKKVDSANSAGRPKMYEHFKASAAGVAAEAAPA